VAETPPKPHAPDGEPAQDPRRPGRLRVDGRDNATISTDRHVLVAASDRPRLSWIVPLTRNGQRQVEFEVRLSDADAPAGTTAPSEHRVTSADPWMIMESPLRPNAAYFWSVRTRDDQDRWSEWSESSRFETGPFTLADWRAKWVTAPALSTTSRVFTIDPLSVSRGRLHLTAQGLVRASVNGTAVNADSSDPSRTDFARALYRTYDVTDLLIAGENTLDLTLAHGEWHRTGLSPRVLAEIAIRQNDGTVHSVGTGAGMTARRSRITVEEPFYLERHDDAGSGYPLGVPDVLEPEIEPNSPAAPPFAVTPDPSPPLRVQSSLECSEVSRVGDDRIFAVPTNIAGRSLLSVVGRLRPGTVLKVTHGELVDDAGLVDTTNLSLPFDAGRARQVVEYVATGQQVESFEPWFCYHGFAFVQVGGLPADAAVTVTARPLHTDLTAASSLSTNDPIISTLVARARRTLLNNVHGIPEDCPTREQSGWTGDTASVTEFEFSSFDMEGFFRKWLGDIRTSQLQNGAIPAIAPDLRPEKVPSDPVWGSALQRTLVAHWRHYGDARVLADNLPALRRWVDFQLSCVDQDGVVGHSPISYGHDWLALDQTPPRLHHTVATLESLGILAQLEAVVGRPDDAAFRLAQQVKLRTAATRMFVDPSTESIGNGSQGSLALALSADLLSDGLRAVAVQKLEDDIRRRGNRLSSGFATTRFVLGALADNGRSQVIFDAVNQPLVPGIGAMLREGPGTMWENWWIDPTNTGTGSLDHIGLGGPFAGWAEQRLAGVRPRSGGYATFDVAPQFVNGINELSYQTSTVRGIVAVRYRRTGARVQLSITVPVGSSAYVDLPGQSVSMVASGHHRFECQWSGEVQAGPTTELPVWRPPARMSESSDITGENSSLWPSSIGTISARAGVIEEFPEGVICMPVPHAQFTNAVAAVTGAADGRGPVARIDFTHPLDLTSAAFAFAYLDACAGNEREPSEMSIAVISVDGSRVVGSGHFWPAGWNRVTAGLDGWAGRAHVTAIEVSLAFAPLTGEPGPLTFRLGMAGASTRRRTW
jgi:alpha-L-rhamnosidase